MSEPRLATDADALRFQTLQSEFFASIGVLYRAPTLARLREKFRQRNVIAMVSDHGVCTIIVYESSQDAQVGLFPRGIDAALLEPLLTATLREVWSRYSEPRWRVWATFMGGLDREGKPDGGEAECRTWGGRDGIYLGAEVIGDRKSGFSVGGTFREVIPLLSEGP